MTNDMTPQYGIAHASEMLAALQACTGYLSKACSDEDDRAIVIASAALAIAHELRELRNAHAMRPAADATTLAADLERLQTDADAEVAALRGQLAAMDADNAALIERNREMTEHIKQLHSDGRKSIRKIAELTAALDIATGNAPAANGRPVAIATTHNPTED